MAATSLDRRRLAATTIAGACLRPEEDQPVSEIDFWNSASWDTYRELLDRAARPAAWSRVAHWAIDVLAEELGADWPARAGAWEQKNREILPLVGALKSLGWRTLALVEAVEWAARLRLIGESRGAADLRRDLGRDVSAGRMLHTDLQLETAALAICCGWDVQLEPWLPGAERPADLLIASPGATLIVETRVLTEAPTDRSRRARVDEAFDRLTLLAAAHRTWLEGDLGDPLDEWTVRELERRIPVEALAARAGLRPTLAVGSARVRLVRREDATARLTAAGLSSDLWPRMAAAIAGKATQMAESGAGWLRLIPYNNFFLLTDWAQLPLAEKLEKLASTVRSSLAGRLPSGVVVSSGAGLYAGEVAEETIRTSSGIAIRRPVRPLRARESLIMPISDQSRDATGTWEALLNTEVAWLPWVLDKFELPRLADILPPA